MLVQALIQQRFYVGANGWLKASLLEPVRARKDCGLFAAQIRQPSRARGLR
ncbi:hypothetical protein KSP24_16470 [Paenibacillus sp. AK121]|uniref:hypothetical protein n=1 Tax=Paenibacillus sp. AK121 TaxID=2849670 RepID=UPI001C236A11|nr:hypothetical protein [Paenibacillus sp. AK121]MBU9708511.1 hypothetical protein [Paenibacillus sp. AK121]